MWAGAPVMGLLGRNKTQVSMLEELTNLQQLTLVSDYFSLDDDYFPPLPNLRRLDFLDNMVQGFFLCSWTQLWSHCQRDSRFHLSTDFSDFSVNQILWQSYGFKVCRSIFTERLEALVPLLFLDSCHGNIIASILTSWSDLRMTVKVHCRADQTGNSGTYDLFRCSDELPSSPHKPQGVDFKTQSHNWWRLWFHNIWTSFLDWSVSSGVQVVSSLTKLEHLDLMVCKYVTDAAVGYFTSLINLKILRLHATGATDFGLGSLRKLSLWNSPLEMPSTKHAFARWSLADGDEYLP